MAWINHVVLQRPPTCCLLPFTFFAGQEDANCKGLPTTRSSNLAGEREANWTPVSNPFAIEGESGKKTTQPFLSADLLGVGAFSPYAPRQTDITPIVAGPTVSRMPLSVDPAYARHPRSSERIGALRSMSRVACKPQFRRAVAYF